jgi:hypothetical protein
MIPVRSLSWGKIALYSPSRATAGMLSRGNPLTLILLTAIRSLGALFRISPAVGFTLLQTVASGIRRA